MMVLYSHELTSDHDSAMLSSMTVTPYKRLGGAAALRELVERFYGYMDTLPEVQTVRRMHADDLGSAKEKLFKFLSGWLGGPDLYWQEFGHPRLRMRHFPFSIGKAERDQWLLCMRKALDDILPDDRFRDALYQALAQTADHMINRIDSSSEGNHSPCA
jgi:hemoglobin